MHPRKLGFTGAETDGQPLVSVVIPIKDPDPNEFDACLDSIEKQAETRKEIIVVSSASSPRIQRIAQEHNVEIINRRVSKAQARNIGTARSRGELLLHLDVDMMLTRDVLVNCIKKRREGYEAIIIPEQAFGKGFLGECRRLEKQSYIDDPVTEAARCVSRRLDERIGGFDETTGTIDEYAYHAKIERTDFKIARIDQTIITNEPVISLRKKFNHGKHSKVYMARYPEKAKPQFSPLRRVVLFSRLGKTKPLHFITLLFLKFLDLAAFLAGWVVGYLSSERTLNLPDYFDGVATTYESTFTSSLGGRQLNELEKNAIQRMLELASDSNQAYAPQYPIALDMGSGTGRLSGLLIDKGYYTLGLDISHEMCKTTKKRYGDFGFEAIRADMTHLPIQPEKVSLILSFRSAKYVHNLQQIFNEVNTTLNQKGFFLLELPNAFSPFYIMGKALSRIARKLTHQPTVQYMAEVQLFTPNQCLNIAANNNMYPIAFESLFLAPQALSTRLRSSTILRTTATLEKIIISKLHINSLSRSLLFLIAKRT